jgi:peptidoglycan/LPS O-acetylase OafA/YrhL
MRGWKRYGLGAAAALIAGPNILMMFPIWLLGVLAFRLSHRTRLSGFGAIALFFASLAVIGLGEFLADGRGLLARHFSTYYPPGFSALDYLVGAALAANLLAACSLTIPFGRLGPIVKRCAGYSFSIYLYHLPLLYLCAAFLPTGWPVALRGVAMLTVTMASIVVLSSVTETRKDALHRFLLWGASALDQQPLSTVSTGPARLVGESERTR